MIEHDEPTRSNDITLTSLTPVILPPVQVPEYEVHERDDDSGVETEHSSTESISSSIFAYRTINGREYHRDGWNTPYCFPIDEPQMEAQAFNNLAISDLLDERLHLAPLEANIKSVLDVGTGQGLWAIEFAEEHPFVEVIGTDLSPIQERWIPPNLRFELEDCTQDWTWKGERFDYLHLRGLGGSIKDWPRLLSEAYRCTKPGGLVESHEPSFKFKSDHESIKPGSPLEQMREVFEEAGDKTGCSFTVADAGTQKKSMEDAGFTIVQEECLKMPIGGWPKDPGYKQLGQIALLALLRDLEGYLLYATTQVLEWQESRAKMLMMGVRKQIMEKKMYVYVEHRIVVGRKL